MKLKVVASLIAATLVAAVASAENWYNNGNSVYNVTSWTNAQGVVCSAFNDADIYWVVGAAKGPGWNNFSTIKNLCLGAPSESPSGFAEGRQACDIQNRTMTVDNFVWFNGSIYAGSKKQSWLKGTAKLVKETSDVTHQIYNNVTDGSVGLDMNLVSDDSSLVLKIGGAGKTLDYTAMMQGFVQLNAYYTLRGDNSGFKGSYSVESPFQTVWLGGANALGDPGTPNASAMTLCNNAAIGFQKSTSQSATRGIQLLGDQAYLLAFSAQADTSGFVCRYPISKAKNAGGVLIKDGDGSVTLDCDYSAGVIRVAAGTLVLGESATFPSGQRIVICDGARVVSRISTAGFDIVTEGSGTLSYDLPEGYRQGANGIEVRISASSKGAGSVSADEIWIPVGETASLTATPDVGKSFLCWTGGLGALKDRDVYSPNVTVTGDRGSFALVAVFGDTPVAPSDYTHSDGTTFTFADGKMTVTVPVGVTCSYDYSSFLSSGYVREVVKAGSGALVLASAPGYVGGFTIADGYVLLSDEGDLGADDCGTVTIRAGGAIWLNTADVVARGKLVRMAGSGSGSDASVKGAIRSVLANSQGVAGRFELTDDAEIYLAENSKILSESAVDLSGKTLTVSSVQFNTCTLTDVSFWNGSDVPATLNFAGKSTRAQFSGCTFSGTGQVVAANDCRCQMLGSNAGGWSIVPGYIVRLFGQKNTKADDLSYVWAGGASIPSGSNLYIGSSSVAVDSVLCFDGPLTGEGSCRLDGGVLHWFSSESDFAGTFFVLADAGGKNTLRTTLYLRNGSALNAKGITIEEATLRMDDSTAFDLPEVLCRTGNCTIAGGPVGTASCGRAVIAAISQPTAADEGVLLVDSPVVVTGLTSIARGTLRLGTAPYPYMRLSADQLPVFSNLVFAAGTAFDLADNDLMIPSLAGQPTILNAGAVTISDFFVVSAADMTEGRVLDFGGGTLAFAPGAKIVIDDSTLRPRSNMAYEIVSASGGITGTPAVETVRGRAGWTAKVDATGTKLVVQRNAGAILGIR